MTQQIESSEVVDLAERVLAFALFFVYREEFRCDNLTTILDGPSQYVLRLNSRACTHSALKTIKVECAPEGAHELAGQRLSTLLTQAHLPAAFSVSTSARSLMLMWVAILALRSRLCSGTN